ncbi:SUKH-4 family immunity protein [Mycobacterium sp. SP-6446]|uniref:SUKH-4 family immunity protein n=1 Tax=Mycobacterium sp. SP-6446 TaxID=1834162 RepID=UPI00158D8C46|nr:SUKH-4 family immunity protein [Mycobacterium sp. SP-6446]
MNEFWVGITAEELHQVWDGQLQPIPQELIPAAVSPEVRRLLTEVGLPTAEVMGINFVFDSRLSSTVSQNGHDYLAVTDTWPIPFAVDTQSDWVVEFDQHDPEHTRFFNTDLATLILFLGRLWRVTSRETASEALADLAEIRLALCSVDPAAMAEGAAWCLWLDDLESQIR